MQCLWCGINNGDFLQSSIYCSLVFLHNYSSIQTCGYKMNNTNRKSNQDKNLTSGNFISLQLQVIFLKDNLTWHHHLLYNLIFERTIVG